LTLELTCTLDSPPERVWEAVNRPALFGYITRPLAVFVPVEPTGFPEVWEEREYTVQIRLFGVIPAGWQVIGIERLPPTGASYRLRDNGRGSIARRWDHVMTIEPASTGRTRYTDHVEIEAGVLTPFVWLLARLFYGHRQRRWQRLVQSGYAAVVG
jgi:ligand-binding SRPBCC domain-containing protein